MCVCWLLGCSGCCLLGCCECWLVVVLLCVLVGWLVCWLLDYSVGNEISSFHSFVSLPLIFQGIYTLISQILPYRTRTEGESRGAACATLQGRGFES